MKPIIICLTPVKNEAWILDKFLQAASLWANYIIIADQQSTDDSKRIAMRYPKVIWVENTQTEYNEVDRQKLLLAEARKIEGKKLLIALDADEFFSDDFIESNDWRKMLESRPGTVFGFKWINLLPGLKKGWITQAYYPWAYIDDGRGHIGKQMHSPRIPYSPDDDLVKITDFAVFHMQYVNWKRMESKHRYYQCLERLKYPDKNYIDIFRQYAHMYQSRRKSVNIHSSTFNFLIKNNIELKKINTKSNYWFDNEVENLLIKYGTEYFKKVNIWNINWSKRLGNEIYTNPQNIIEKIIFTWFRCTRTYQDAKLVKRIDEFIRYHL
jgi:hypothetical protein